MQPSQEQGQLKSHTDKEPCEQQAVSERSSYARLKEILVSEVGCLKQSSDNSSSEKTSSCDNQKWEQCVGGLVNFHEAPLQMMEANDSCDVKDRIESTADVTQLTSQTDSVEIEDDDIVKFVPQLYVQRYGFVRRILHQKQAKSVVDFASAQLKIMTMLKTVQSLEKISLVDLNKRLIEKHKDFIKPLIYDYLQRRGRPLSVRVYHGDARRLDSRLVGCDAVTMVEFIEHLLKPDLEEVAQRVFGDLHPRLVVVTTPNAEFNVLFPNFSGFRDPDHKFEWTRKEFQNWCTAVCDRYGYEVEFSGVGDPPVESSHVGHCSQAAIFNCIDHSSIVDIQGTECYTLVETCEYPYTENKLSLEDRLGLEVQYHLRNLTLNSDLNLDSSNFLIPVDKLYSIRQIKQLCDMTQLRSFLRSHYRLTSDGDHVLIPTEEDSSDGETLDTECTGSRDDEIAAISNTDRQEEEPWC